MCLESDGVFPFLQRYLAVNQVATFLSSSFIVSKIFSMLESEINKFASSGNIIGVNLIELLKTSFSFLPSNTTVVDVLNNF